MFLGEVPRILKHGRQISMETANPLGANAVDLFNNGVFHTSPHAIISSSGVQITGQRYPHEVMSSSMRGRFTALAICVQFQVKR